MCGIFGAINLNGSDCAEIDKVTTGIGLMRHRGPDGHGVETAGPVSFGHARLSIIDLDLGKQPMQDHTGTGIITYNGEVYNFPEIRKDLEKTGRRFDTHSDTEVVLNACLEWGEDCLEHFRGMFSFACYDTGSGKALIARDRAGKKPLFYTTRNGTLFFSSEIEPLYRVAGPFRINPEALDDYLYWQYIPAPRTIYRDVHCLPPAHYLAVDTKSGQIVRKRYWGLSFKEDRSLSFDDWLEELDCVLRESVRLRLVSDVPFGAFLSGGIDSSLVVGYMSDILNQPVKTFSIGFENADFSELQYAKQVAELCGTEHYTKIVKVESLGILPLLVKHYGQPFADSSAIPTYYVSRMARENVKMVLSGDGGDENFAGYNTYEYVVSGQVKKRQEKFGERLTRYALGLLGRARPILEQNSGHSIFDLYSSVYKHFSSQERDLLYNERYASLVDNEQSYRRSLLALQGDTLVSRLQHLDILTYLPYDILTKVDIASMANSLEVRTPLLDHRLMEIAATIPASFKLREIHADGQTTYDKKYILKALALKRFPKSVIERPKKGFGIPLGDWFAGGLREDVRGRLVNSKHLPLFFNMDTIQRILNEHSRVHDMSAKIWNLLFLNEWMVQHENTLDVS